VTILTRINELGCGCGAADHQGGLMAIDEAIARIIQTVCEVSETEEVALAAACGRVLADPVRARSAAPPFDNSAMDGYALDSISLTGAGPWRLEVTARIAAGQVASGSIRRGAAAQIFTGAPIPQGADAVVMQEDVDVIDDAIIISRKIRPRANIRTAGEDMAAGSIVVPSGRLITSRDVAACAAAGAATVRVRRRVRVALVVTGDEVNSSGQSLTCAGIWDVNSPMLSAQIASPGIEFIPIESGKDNRNALCQQLGDLAKRVDLLITTGGISVGEEDHVKPALNDLGATMVFSGVAMKPGKPVSFGRLADAHWLGLPGNPLSAFIGWQLFGTVLLRALAGDTTSPRSRRRNVVLSRVLDHKYGRCELRLADLSGFDGLGREIAIFEDATHSGRVARLPVADGVLFIPSESENLPEGALVEFQPFCD
jgi:molybdopterin molybdotransferase